MRFLILTIVITYAFLSSCKDKAELKAIDNRESLGQSKEYLVDDSEKLVELSNHILTSIDLTEIANKKKLKFKKLTEFFNNRNQALFDEVQKVADSLSISILESPSETMSTTIDKFKRKLEDTEFAEMFENWIHEYAIKLEEIASWMIKSSDNNMVIALGAKVNSYIYALNREFTD